MAFPFSVDVLVWVDGSGMERAFVDCWVLGNCSVFIESIMKTIVNGFNL